DVIRAMSLPEGRVAPRPATRRVRLGPANADGPGAVGVVWEPWGDRIVVQRPDGIFVVEGVVVRRTFPPHPWRVAFADPRHVVLLGEPVAGDPVRGVAVLDLESGAPLAA